MDNFIFTEFLKTFNTGIENSNLIFLSVSERENNSTEILSAKQFQKYVIKRFEQIIVLLEQSNASSIRVLNSLQMYMNPTLKPDGFPDLPLTTDDEFQKLELMLSEKATDNSDDQEASILAYTYLVFVKKSSFLYSSSFL